MTQGLWIQPFIPLISMGSMLSLSFPKDEELWLGIIFMHLRFSYVAPLGIAKGLTTGSDI